jgi:hypothetical protein
MLDNDRIDDRMCCVRAAVSAFFLIISSSSQLFLRRKVYLPEAFCLSLYTGATVRQIPITSSSLFSAPAIVKDPGHQSFHIFAPLTLFLVPQRPIADHLITRS